MTKAPRIDGGALDVRLFVCGEVAPTHVSAVMMGIVVIFIPIPKPSKHRQMNSSHQFLVNA